MKQIYLDYAATTPIDARVANAAHDSLAYAWANTMSLHSFGQQAKAKLEEVRGLFAKMIGAKPGEIFFTASATESNNTALKGVAFANRQKGNHIIISAIEHPCVEESAGWLSKNGFEITKIGVDKYGLVNPEDVRKAITDKTILVSVIHASNEIGTIEPIGEIGKICRERGVYFHTDASQSFVKIPINVQKMNIDLLTASSHKIYGPKGAALLYVRSGVRIQPLLHGGGQENGMRSSTVNLPAITGFAKAAELCSKEMAKESRREIKLRDNLIEELLKIDGSHLNGHPKKRLPNNVNVWFEFIEGESLVIHLDLHGIACSSGSACSSAKLEPSPILLATGLQPGEAHGSLRISIGRWTKESDIKYLVRVLPKIIDQLRAISPFKKHEG